MRQRLLNAGILLSCLLCYLESLGVILMAVLVLLLALIGVLSKNPRIGLSILPFLTLAVVHFARRKL